MRTAQTFDREMAQRVLDVALVTVSAPLWAPVLLVLFALKALIDGRPVFFAHERLGRGGIPFLLYKIRSTPRAFHARPEDWPSEEFPPRTRFGQWLRRWDLDELPQLWNVLRGEMSLVGPRPETPYHSAKFSAEMPRFHDRLQVRPGLTGLAQVRGWRGDTNVYARLSADLEYLNRRGFRLWLSVLLCTLWIEASGEGRYTASPVPRAMRSQSDVPNL